MDDGYHLGFRRDFQRLIWNRKVLISQTLSIITNYRHIYGMPHVSPRLMCLWCPLPFLFWPAALCRPPSLCSLSLYMHSYAGGCKNSLFGGVGWGCWSMVRVGISNEEELALCWQQSQDRSQVKWCNRDRERCSQREVRFGCTEGVPPPCLDGSL